MCVLFLLVNEVKGKEGNDGVFGEERKGRCVVVYPGLLSLEGSGWRGREGMNRVKGFKVISEGQRRV